jgi:histone-lysine N-methyltransferase SUV420H
MTRTTGFKGRPAPLVLPDDAGSPPPVARSGRIPTTGRKGPPARYEAQTNDQGGSGEERESASEEDEEDEEEEPEPIQLDSDSDVESEPREGFVEEEIDPDDSDFYSPRQLELIQLASDLSANDDLLSCIFVDTFGSMNLKDDLGVYYHQGDFVKPNFDRKQVLEMAQRTIVQGNMDAALDGCLRLPIIRQHLLKLRSNSQIKKFVAHLKRYVMLYHPTSRIEIRTTDRYRFATNKSELAVFSTVDLDPGLTEYVIMDIQNVDAVGAAEPPKSAESAKSKFNQPSLHGLPNIRNGMAVRAELPHLGNNLAAEPKPQMLVLDEITGAMEVMPKVWEQRLSANAVDDHESQFNPISAAQNRKGTRNVPYGDMDLENNALGGAGSVKKMAEIRDFSVVNSGRQGLMLFLGPGRFINHDCSPNVELITTKRNVITFRVLRKIRVGEELTTW